MARGPKGKDKAMIHDLRGTLPTLEGDWPILQYVERPLDAIVGVTLHYTAAPANQTARAIALYQTSREAIAQTTADQPFPAIAYTILITQDGDANLCHDLDRRTWHSGAVVNGLGRNLTHVGICYTGNVEPNAAQVDGFADAIDWCELQLMGHQLSIEGHKDPPYSTDCPGPRWPTWRPRVEAALAIRRDRRAHDVTNGFTVRSDFSNFLEQNPEWGRARMNEMPIVGGACLWLTTTATHPKGGLLVYREWLRIVQAVSWD
jgi:hypothetical protein